MSKSKSKTSPISRNSSKTERPRVRVERPKRATEPEKPVIPVTPAAAELPAFELPPGEEFAVGFAPTAEDKPQDPALFRAFQSNLLSLISHELRTPLTGVLNALNVLDSENGEAGADGFSQKELIRMARKNAHRLHQVLVTLLDLASLESGTFHGKLREIDLARIVRSRIDAVRSILQASGHEVTFESVQHAPVLANAQKLARGIDLALELSQGRSSSVKVLVEPDAVEFRFELGADQADWAAAWSQALTGFESGLGSPASAFGGVMQAEEAFLSRTREGLGSELVLLHQIMRLHHGHLAQRREGRTVCLRLEFPSLSSEEGLRAVLSSRAYGVSHELASVAVSVVAVPKNESPAKFAERMKTSLFRTSDAVYPLPEKHEVVLVLDDCKPEDAERIMKRLQSELGGPLQFGTAHCPADALDPAMLLELAERRRSK